jgi:hypothetical protein
MVALTFISIAAARLTVTFSRKLITVTSIVVIVAIAASLKAPLFTFQSVRDFNTYNKIKNYALDHRAQFITGDYWKVWTTVFFLKEAVKERGVEDPNFLFGVDSRGAVNMVEMDGVITRNIRDQTESIAVCINATQFECISSLEGITSFSWEKIDESDCDKTCYLFKANQISDISVLKIDETLAAGVDLRATARQTPDRIIVGIAITNSTGKRLSSLNRNGPLRLSWTFTPETEYTSNQNRRDWLARKDLTFSLDNGQTYTDEFEIEYPISKEPVKLELSIVLEGVAWLHDFGMTIPVISIKAR